MPVYSYRCSAVSGHVSEYRYSMADYPATELCGTCGAVASLVILQAPLFSVDRLSEEFNIGAGQVFHNRSERKEWCRQTGHHEVGPEDSQRYARELRDLREAKADLGDAWDGDIPGRKEALRDAARKKAREAYDVAEEGAVRDLQRIVDSEPPRRLRRVLRRLKAESAGVTIGEDGTVHAPVNGTIVAPVSFGRPDSTPYTSAGSSVAARV